MSASARPSSPVRPAETSSAAAGPGCPDLLALAGGRYRVEQDPAHVAEHGERSRPIDPWLLVIHCRFGHVYPWGRDRLALSTDGRGETAQQMAALPFVRIEQEGADGFTLTFRVDRFDEIAAVARPHKLVGRSSMAADERKQAAERLRPFRFRGRATQNRRPKSERKSTLSASDDSGHVQASPRAIAVA